jgi:putative sigma-54 modulation protein
MDLTQAIRNIVHEKLEKLFRHDPTIVRIRVELIHDHSGDKNQEFVAKGIISVQGPDIVVSVASTDLYKSIDELVDKLNRQLSKRSEIERSRRKEADHAHKVELEDEVL